MVSLMLPPAASDATVRRVTVAFGGAVNMARNLPLPSGVTWAVCQVFPLSNDACTFAPVTLAAFASCRCPTVIVSSCRPAGADSFRPRWATSYSSVIMGCTVQELTLGFLSWQSQPDGSAASGRRTGRQIHTVWLAVVSGNPG